MSGIKEEIKGEEVGGQLPQLSTVDDHDIYEDAGDLEFFDPQAVGPNYANIYLARVGKLLWDTWSKMDDDEELQIGTIRQWYEKGESMPRMKMLLNSQISAHKPLPKEYNLSLTTDVTNTFVFTEEDLPQFKDKSKARTDAAEAGIPLSLLRPKAAKVEKPKFDKKARYQPYYRKAIPKKTKILGRVAYDLACSPANTTELKLILARQSHDVEHTKVRIIGRQLRPALHVGTSQASAWENNFIKTGPKPTKVKASENKATRLPENELLDLLFKSFDRYQYWSMKTLRHELQQPEAYLRQTLEKIAQLNKSGRFANLWSLRPENINLSTHATADEIAPDETGDDDDEEPAMEDVLMQ